MNTLDYRQFSHRKLPHIHSPGKTLFVTYRLIDSIPQAVLKQHQQEKQLLRKQLEKTQVKILKLNEREDQEIKEKLESFRRRWFLRFEEILDQAESGPTWLQDQRLAKIVADSLHYHDQKSYQLQAYCVMSNHVHVVMTPFLNESELQENWDDEKFFFSSPHASLSKIMHSLKSYTAHECNKILERTGQFWEVESFDHTIRAGKFEKTINYVTQNPVKAGLVKNWQDWKWSYKRKNVG
jgi:putative transposase